MNFLLLIHTIIFLKIKSNTINITKITYKLTADKVSYGQTVFQNEDPKELFIAVNEFAWNITKNQRNSNNACYWLEWILGFEDLCKKDKKKYLGGRRNIPVISKFQKDIIWIVWDCLLWESKNRNKALQFSILNLMLQVLYSQNIHLPNFVFLINDSYCWLINLVCTCDTVSIATTTTIKTEVPPK